MSIPLFAILILYFLFLTGIIIFALFNVYHALRFGMAEKTNIIALLVFIGGAIVLIGTAVPTITRTDWDEELFQVGVIEQAGETEF